MEVSFGARLREQRERQQITLTTIAAETKISVAALEGLERDDLSRWPGGIFRRAYVRSYAQAVGLEPETVVREFMERHPESVVEVQPQASASDVRPERPLGALGFLRAGLAGFRPLRDAFRHADQPAGEPPAATEAVLDLAPAEPELAAAPAPSPEPTITPVLDCEPSRPPDVRPMKRPRSRTNGAHRPPAQHPVSLDRDLMAISRLCTSLGCARDQSAVSDVLEDAVRILDARGVVVWVWDAMCTALSPVVSHGYSHAVLRQLPRVGASSDNAIAAAFRSERLRVVDGEDGATGAIAVPLVASNGCVGVVAFEFVSGGEQSDRARAFATILAAQLSTLVPVSVLVEAVSA